MFHRGREKDGVGMPLARVRWRLIRQWWTLEDALAHVLKSVLRKCLKYNTWKHKFCIEIAFIIFDKA